MKNLLVKILIIVIGFSFNSCTKDIDYHKITYQVEFLIKPSSGSSNMIETSVSPRYEDVEPNIDEHNLPKIWRYEYYGLKSGDKVMFSCRGQLSYEYEMKIFIDDVEVSYLHVITHSSTYFSCLVVDRHGINDLSQAETNAWGKVEDNTATIVFTYQ